MNARKPFTATVVGALALMFLATLWAQDSGNEKLTWEQSSKMLLQVVINNNWIKE